MTNFKKRRSKIWGLFMVISFSCVTVLSTSCSYKEFEDQVRNKIQEKTGQEKTGQDETGQEETATVEEKENGAVTFEMEKGEGRVRYSVTDAVFYEDYHLSGIQKSDFDFDGKLKAEEKQGFILLSVKIENIDCHGENSDGTINVSDIQLLDSTDEDGITDMQETKAGLILDEIYFPSSYLSMPGEGDDYWHMYLKPGEEQEIKIGIFVPVMSLEEAKKYVVSLGTKKESGKITLTEGGDSN